MYSPKVRSFDLYDVESGISNPGRYARRFVARRARWISGALVAAGLVLLLSDFRLGPARHPQLRPLENGEHGRGTSTSDELKNIWVEGAEGAHHEKSTGWGWGFGSPLRLAGSTKPELAQKIEGVDHKGLLDFDSYIAPMHPDLSLLPSPSDLLSEVKLPAFLKPPETLPFPDTRLREIISQPPTEASGSTGSKTLPADAFSRTWVRPEIWDQPRGQMRRVQWEGFARGREGWESDEQRAVREERREAVKRGFAWAWQGYKTFAWGHDEIKPVSQTPSNPFNTWGASIIDTLDTLLIMGLSDEYNLCRPHVNQLKFQWVDGRDWSQGYVSEPQPTDDEEDPKEVWMVVRDKAVALPVFETAIRYLGGLLGAFDLSGDQLVLERAIDLADILGKAFNTQSGLPAGRIDPGSDNEIYRLNTVSIAEVGSMSLELIRLSQITDDRKWFDLAQRAMDFLDQRIIPRAVHTPLIPMWLTPDAQAKTAVAGALTLGGLADSYYEYLIKTYKLLGASEGAKQWRRIYEQSVDKVKEVLYVDIKVVPGRDILALGKLEAGRLIPEIEHLTCFAGAMLGLGARLLGRSADMVDAERFTQSCYWLSAATPTGLQPEVVEFFVPGKIDYHNVTLDGRPYHPSLGEKPLDESLIHKDREGVLRWNADDELVSIAGEGKVGSEVEYVQRLSGSPPGARKVVGRGINRPETIESIFYMYRLTGDRKWQEKGWKMFVSWITAAKVDGGISSIVDVTKKEYTFLDNMESFMFAETLKYHFLLQSEPDLLSLDDYVLNTEAHPFLTNPNLQSGSQIFWRRPPSDQNLGVRGQGTDAQKWRRLEVLRTARGGKRPIVGGQGGGQGLGGGGGDPNFRPKRPVD